MLRWGNARELCLGLEVVTATGAVWEGLTGLRKDNTGYDLRDLFIGSEGTLGIITAATLKLQPRPAATGTALAATGSLEQCMVLLGLAQARLGAGLTGFVAGLARQVAKHRGVVHGDTGVIGKGARVAKRGAAGCAHRLVDTDLVAVAHQPVGR